MREFSFSLLLSAVLALPAAAAEAPPVWDAHIAVASQQGATCRLQPAVPHERRFVLIGDPGSATPLVASGEGEGLHLVLESPRSRVSPAVAIRYTLQALTEGGARRGSLLLEPAAEGFVGRWQEITPEPGQPGCAWTEARIVLHPLTDTDASAARIALLTQAIDIAARQTSRAADTGVWPAADLAEFARLGSALAATDGSDLSLAQLYLSVAEALRFARRREDALALMDIAVALHRPLGPRWPREVALVLGRDAQFRRSRGAWDEAALRYAEALALLQGHVMLETEAAAQIYAEQGALFIRTRRFDEAAAALARAATLDGRHSGTSTLDRAVTLNNLGHALLLGGHGKEARTAFERALAQLSRSEPAQLALIEIIESAQAAITAQPESDPATPPNAPSLRGTAHIS